MHLFLYRQFAAAEQKLSKVVWIPSSAERNAFRGWLLPGTRCGGLW